MIQRAEYRLSGNGVRLELLLVDNPVPSIMEVRPVVSEACGRKDMHGPHIMRSFYALHTKISWIEVISPHELRNLATVGKLKIVIRRNINVRRMNYPHNKLN
jgi:hypothetical protein